MEKQELPEHWTQTTVGEVCTALQYGYTASASKAPCGPRFLRITDIQNGQVQWSSVPYCEIDEDQPPKYELHTGDIVFARTGGTVGKSFIISSVPEQSVFASYLIRLSAHPEIEPKFLYYFFQSGSYWEQIDLKKGGLQGNVNATTLSSLELSICPLNEQRRIVAKIEELFSALDQGIESLQTAREQLKIYRQSALKHAFEGKLTKQWRAENRKNLETAEKHLAHIKLERDARYQPRLAEWKDAVKAWEAEDKQGKKPSKPNQPKEPVPFTKNELDDLPKLPSTWKYARLGAFIEDIQAGKSFKCDEREPNSVEIGVAKVSAVSWGEYDERECKTCVDPERINPDLFIRTDDFLFSRANTIELVGACVIVQSTRKNIMLSDKTLRIHFASGQKGYFLQYLRSHSGRNEIMRRSTGNQDSMRNIGQDRIRSIITPACSAAEMAEIEKELAERFSLVEALDAAIEDELARSEALHQSILRRAFSGQLVVQDPNDEPASVLLKRIKVDKFAQLEHRKTNKKGKQAA